MLLVDIDELWDGYLHLVGSPNKVSFLLRFLVLDALRLLIELNRVFNWVRNLRESLFFFAVAEFLLLNFDLVGNYDVAW